LFSHVSPKISARHNPCQIFSGHPISSMTAISYIIVQFPLMHKIQSVLITRDHIPSTNNVDFANG
jgi:hypothetical protein